MIPISGADRGKLAILLTGLACVFVATSSSAFTLGDPHFLNFADCFRVQVRLPDYAASGHFTRASLEEHQRLGQLHQEWNPKVQSGFHRMTEAELDVNLDQMTPEEIEQVARNGVAGLHQLYYLTSGAGLWSRGGSQVKALLPFNIKSLLSPREFDLVVKAGAVAKADGTEKILAAAGVDPASVPARNAEAIARQIIHDAKGALDRLISKARSKPEALTPIDLKLANVAVLSQKAGPDYYVPFDILTSEPTHRPIADYLEDFYRNYRTKTFSLDKAVDARIKVALRRYIALSRLRGETHLLGYQVGFHGLHPDTHQHIPETAAIGEGAGMTRDYLDNSGRLRQLGRMGKKVMVFENIEVVSDLSVGMGAHLRAQEKTGAPVSVVLVPTRPGYEGGSPYAVEGPDGKKISIVLHEASAVAPELRKDNLFFNSNTIYQDLGVKVPYHPGFENKTVDGQPIIRAKVNAGDVTHGARTAAILGRIGDEYENFKGYPDYGANGQKQIDAWRRALVSSLVRQP